ncbi:MAG: hypothetical protein K6F32_06455 [Bacilli bacterium]|nr:hypothetical protein [Bacilli bacterium]
MKKLMKRWSLYVGLLACSLSFLAGCGGGSSDKTEPANQEEVITKILEESDPMATVHVGEFEHLESEGTSPIAEDAATYGSSSILDMPRDQAVHVVYDNSENRSLQSVSCLLTNIVEANNDVHIVSIKDRNGKYKNNLLSSDGEKLLISSAGGFEYGEVYQIEINDAPYLSFEGKDPQIRKLTIEIEDDPTEEATYDEKALKQGIVNVDRSKVKNKKQGEKEGTYSIEFDGEFPAMSQGDVFFATIAGRADDRQDFYGVFEKKEGSTITYSAPNFSDIYESFRMKGVEDADLTGAEVLLTDEFAVQQFKQSSLARGIVRHLLSINPKVIRAIVEAMRFLKITIDLNMVGNRLEEKIILKLPSIKIEDNRYIAIEIGHQTITEYTFDFDLKLNYKWIFPCGVDYKVKCIEESQNIWYFRVSYDHQPISDLKPSDKDATNALLDDIMNAMDGKYSTSGELLDPDGTTPSTSGTKTTVPLIYIDFHYFTPLQIRFRLDFYFDIGFQAMGLVKYETRSTRVDFNFTNMDGTGQDVANNIDESSNLVAYLSGGFHAELGLRISLGISFLGLYDYLHVEGYAEAYLNLSITGMIAMDIDFTKGQFSGLYSIDNNLSAGVRAGLHFKAPFFETNIARNWSTVLFRLKFDNPMEHWSEHAATTIDMDKESMSLNETSALWIRYFDPLTMSVKEKQYKANDQFSILSGALLPDSVKKLSSGHTFSYSVEDPTLLEVNEDGLIHVKDGTPVSFTTKITISVSNLVGFIEDRTITIKYTASDVKDIYAGDTLIAQQRPKTSLTLPEAPAIRGKAFEYYEYNGVHYEAGDTFTVPDESVVFSLHYRDLPTYKIYFYDGYGILVAIDEVYEGEDAHEPDQLIRDRYMDEGWAFLYWNRSFKNVHQELHVSGCYFRVS